MGEAAARKEIAARLRKEIGEKAADAVGELRELVEQTNKNMRAIAAGLAQCEKRIDAAAAAPAKLRDQLGELEEQFTALRLRGDARELLIDAVAHRIERVYDGLNHRLEVLENARAETKLQLTKLHHGLVDEFVSCSRWRWLRRRTLAQTMILVAGLRENVD